MRTQFYCFRQVAFGLLSALLLPLLAQSQTSGYQQPDPILKKVIDAAPAPRTSLDPTGTVLLLQDYSSYPPLRELAETELRIGGLRINPALFGPSRRSVATGLHLLPVAGGNPTPVTGLPASPRLGNARWSADGKYIACTHEAETGIELWLVEVATASAKRLVGPTLNATMGSPITWLPDGQHLLVKLRATEGLTLPTETTLPTGPAIQDNLAGAVAPNRTYQDLLKNPADEQRFSYYTQSQLVELDLAGNQKPLGTPAIYRAISPSPDGTYLMAWIVKKPFSYLVPFSRFTTSYEVWDRSGKRVHTLHEQPVLDNLPTDFDAVEPGPRDFAWRADTPATLVYNQAPDGGDPRTKTEFRDEVFALEAPFTGTPTKLLQLGYRARGIQWGSDNLAIVYEYWNRTRQLRAWRFAPGNPSQAPIKWQERSSQDRYNDPGSPVTTDGPYGEPVILTDAKGTGMFLTGAGAGPEGDRPFVDFYTFASGTAERLFQSQAPYYEQPVEVLDAENRVILTSKESTTEPPNFWVVNLKKKVAPRQLTFFKDPVPELRGVSKEIVTYKRADGLELSGTLYLPAGYDKAKPTPLPTLLWAYPREFKDAGAAAQISGSPYRFTRISWGSPLFWALRGYAVMDDPAIPILGKGDAQPNDTYTEQLVAGAKAAIDYLVARGVTDPNRVAVGGHSYGAFMTANLLTHSNLFAGGIARSGAYNRTLTPFGFQAEDRTYWEATEIYQKMSPFTYANQMKTPMLLIHGEADNNSGTFPIQSERYYAALKGHGAPVRYVVLPFESHGYAAYENILHMLWEMDTFLETHVKNRPATGAATPASGSGK